MRAVVVALIAAVVACGRPLPPLATEAAVIDLKVAMHTAARVCTAGAKSLDAVRGEALHDECVRALIPPRDALHFAVSRAEIACAGLAVSVGLEAVRTAIEAAGLDAHALDAGLAAARSVGAHAHPACDPLHPTTSVRVDVDPNIPPVEPDYPPR